MLLCPAHASLGIGLSNVTLKLRSCVLSDGPQSRHRDRLAFPPNLSLAFPLCCSAPPSQPCVSRSTRHSREGWALSAACLHGPQCPQCPPVLAHTLPSLCYIPHPFPSLLPFSHRVLWTSVSHLCWGCPPTLDGRATAEVLGHLVTLAWPDPCLSWCA
jgi:hypothetical protein